MSRAEELFGAELRLRRAAVAYQDCAGLKNECESVDKARKELRAAAVNYAETANDLDYLVEDPNA